MNEPESQSTPSKPKARHLGLTLDRLVTGLVVVEGLLILALTLGHRNLDPKTIQVLLVVLAVIGCLFVVLLVMRMLRFAQRISLRRRWRRLSVPIRSKLSQWYAIIRRNKLLTGTALFLSCGLTVLFDLPELIPAIAIPCMAWFAWRTYRVGVFGTVLAAVTLELITAIVSILYHSRGSIFDLIPFTILIFASIGSMLASIAVFLGHAFLSRAERRQNMLAGVASCVLPFAWFFVGTEAAHVLNDWERDREIARNGVPEFIADLQAITERLGRAPNDEDEAVTLAGRPLPSLPSWGPIGYKLLERKHYVLGFGYDMGCYEFDSERPDARWYVYGGKEAARDAELFYARHPEIRRP